MSVDWKKVNPADLSVTCRADYFALSLKGRSLMVGEINRKCTFTAVIQASVNFNLSIYQMEIWIGYVNDEGRDSNQLNNAIEKNFQDFLVAQNSNTVIYEPALVWEYCA